MLASLVDNLDAKILQPISVWRKDQIGFLISVITFAIGHITDGGKISLDVFERLEEQRTKIVLRRGRLIRIGLIVFVFGTLLAIVSVVSNIGMR